MTPPPDAPDQGELTPAPPPRIVVVTNLWPSQRRPAWGSFVAHRVESLRRLGHEVEVVAVRDHPAGVCRYASLAFATLRRALRGSLRGALRGSRSGLIVEAHIAYPTGIFAVVLARWLGAPLVLFAHGSDVLRLSDRGAGERALARWLFRRARLVVANTDYLAGQVRQRLGVPSARITVVSPGIRYDDFRDARVAAAHRSSTHQTPVDGASVGGDLVDWEEARACFVANLIPRKGLDLLLRAMVESRGRGGPLPALRVVGDGPERERLTEQATAAELPVTFVGACPASHVPREMSGAEIVVVPSREEALGLAALEGMAAGCVTVATSVGGLAEVVQDDVNGILAVSADPPGLADALDRAQQVVADPARCQAMVQAGDQTAREHALDTVVAQTLRRYEELLASPTPSRSRGTR